MLSFFDWYSVGFIQVVFLADPMAKVIAVFLARWAIYLFLVPVVCFMKTKKKLLQHAVAEAAWSGGIALILTTLMAYLIQRPRPYIDMSGISLLIPPPLNTSFPSGHTAASFAIAFAILYADRRWGIFALVLACSIAFGRMAVGVHYPSDIIGGVLVGFVSFVLVRFMHGELKRRDLSQAFVGNKKK
ncbi:MAG: phosphatase PAP2 family protein [Patescibacteria group bacterium]|nr:phosphatase PAP2 family protein [Patescibacteria group bacterium]